MRKIIALEFMTLDGVIQGGGGPTEDTSGGFEYGGWCVPFDDDVTGAAMQEQMGHPFDLLLGRKTFDIWASYWPLQENSLGINEARKYVASNTLTEHEWQETIFLGGDLPAKIRELKKEDRPDLQVYGSADLLQTLFKHDLVDELWLKIFPITLGQGKRLFREGTFPAAFTLTECTAAPSGVIIASYKRNGDVQTGSF
jgi:dihydrofolate reductase